MKATALPGKLRPLWSGYLLVFDKQNQPAAYPKNAGIRLLGACLVLEGLIRPSIRAGLRGLGSAMSMWTTLAYVSDMLIAAVALTRFVIRVPFPSIGIHGWKQWEKSEKWFFPQIMVLASVCFVVPLWSELALLPKQPDWLRNTLVIFAGQMIWGFYQEYVYRGLLQTELVRRCGRVVGILAANLIFTFGPLHAYHFWIAAEDPGHWLIFVSIFATGLYFGVLHGLGDFFLDGIAKLR